MNLEEEIRQRVSLFSHPFEGRIDPELSRTIEATVLTGMSLGVELTTRYINATNPMLKSPIPKGFVLSRPVDVRVSEIVFVVDNDS